MREIYETVATFYSLERPLLEGTELVAALLDDANFDRALLTIEGPARILSDVEASMLVLLQTRRETMGRFKDHVRSCDALVGSLVEKGPDASLRISGATLTVAARPAGGDSGKVLVTVESASGECVEVGTYGPLEAAERFLDHYRVLCGLRLLDA